LSAPETLEGWYALHDFRRLDRAAWQSASPETREKALAEARDLLDAFARVDDAPEGRSVAFAVLGHKADLLLFHLRPEVSHLADLERAFDRTLLGSMTTRPYSYVSVIEISRHNAPEGAAENVENSPYIRSRLRPEIPEHSRYVCFYPMSKKRDLTDNWYTLAPDARAQFMREHGRTGRKYAGKVTQIVTGSMGLDDWEWGVTLFSDDPLQFKKLVYEMRFDEVSARYGEFGPFYVGQKVDDLRRLFGE
jgi:chlorite dismutase